MTTTATPHGQRLRDHRTKAGLTLDEAWADLRQMLPKRYRPSKSAIQRMETHDAEEKWNGLVIFAMSKLYRCRVSDLSPLVAEEYDELSDLVTSSLPWIAIPNPDQTSLDELLTPVAA